MPMTENFSLEIFRSSMQRSKSIISTIHRKGQMKIFATVMVSGIIVGVILFGYVSFAHNHDDESLQQVIICARHGDRTPTETYPNDPYLHYPWENGWGALQKKGILRMYNLGLWLRKQYGHLNDYKYMQKNVEVQSSSSDRCIMSTQALLAGFFPPNEKDAFTPNLLWQPVPVHYTSKDMDKVILVKHPCTRLDKELQKAYAEEEENRNDELKSYYKNVSEHTGKPMKTVTDIEFLYNTLEIEMAENLKLPKWTENYFDERMQQIARQSYAIFTNNDVQKRLRGGPLLKQILKQTEDYVSVNNEKNLYIYGVHDITIVNLLRTMGVEKYEGKLLKPGLGATLVFEIRRDDQNQIFLRIMYMDDSKFEKLEELSIPNCGNHCSLDQLKKIFKNVIPANWDEECQN